MDFDIEMEDAAEAFPDQEEAAPQDILPIDNPQEPGELDETSSGADVEAGEVSRVLWTKVHLRGLDSFKPDDIKAYVKQHVGRDYSRIEWIDDTSANLVFSAESAAAEALVALCAIEIVDATQSPPLGLLPAKAYPARPEAVIQLRFAVEGDRKQVGAAARSRFYLLNPEYDPEERRRKGDFGRARYRDRYSDRYGRGGRGQADRSRDEEPTDTFDVSLYDDDEEALAKRSSWPAPRRRSRSRSRSPSRARSPSRSGPDEPAPDRYARINRDKELFPNRRQRPSFRDRSASPPRTPDWDLEDKPVERGAGSRNRDKARSIKDRLSRDNSTKELFPPKLSTAGAGKAQMDKVDLADRVTRQLGDHAIKPPETGINIRGMASQRTEQGLSIKGAATSAKELFPNKLHGNAGKELFSNKLEGRRPRQKAEDLFR